MQKPLVDVIIGDNEWWEEMVISRPANCEGDNGKGNGNTISLDDLFDFHDCCSREFFNESDHMTKCDFFQVCCFTWMQSMFRTTNDNITDMNRVSPYTLWKMVINAYISGTKDDMNIISWVLPDLPTITSLDSADPDTHICGDADVEINYTAKLMKFWKELFRASEGKSISLLDQHETDPGSRRPTKRRRLGLVRSSSVGFTGLLKGRYKLPAVYLLITVLRELGIATNWEELRELAFGLPSVFKTFAESDILTGLTMFGLASIGRGKPVPGLSTVGFFRTYLYRIDSYSMPVLSILQKATALDTYNLRASICLQVVKQIDTEGDNWSENYKCEVIDACAGCMDQEHPKRFLEDLEKRQCNLQEKRRRKIMICVKSYSVPEKIASPGFPLLIHIQILLLRYQVERAGDLIRKMDVSVSLSEDVKVEAWSNIWNYLLVEGKLLLDGNSDTPGYQRKRDFLYNLVSRVSPRATAFMINFFQEIANRISEQHDATLEEKQYIIFACQQTVLRLLLKVRGLGSDAIQEFLEETSWPVQIPDRNSAEDLNKWGANFLSQTRNIPSTLIDETTGLVDINKRIDPVREIGNTDNQSNSGIVPAKTKHPQADIEPLDVMEDDPLVGVGDSSGGHLHVYDSSLLPRDYEGANYAPGTQNLSTEVKSGQNTDSDGENADEVLVLDDDSDGEDEVLVVNDGDGDDEEVATTEEGSVSRDILAEDFEEDQVSDDVDDRDDMFFSGNKDFDSDDDDGESESDEDSEDLDQEGEIEISDDSDEDDSRPGDGEDDDLENFGDSEDRSHDEYIKNEMQRSHEADANKDWSEVDSDSNIAENDGSTDRQITLVNDVGRNDQKENDAVDGSVDDLESFGDSEDRSHDEYIKNEMQRSHEADSNKDWSEVDSESNIPENDGSTDRQITLVNDVGRNDQKENDAVDGSVDDSHDDNDSDQMTNFKLKGHGQAENEVAEGLPKTMDTVVNDRDASQSPENSLPNKGGDIYEFKQDAPYEYDVADAEKDRGVKGEKVGTEVAAVGGEFGDTTEEEDENDRFRANRTAQADRRADALRSGAGYASQVEDGYEPEDTHGYTEEEVSEAIHTEDEEDERILKQRSRQPDTNHIPNETTRVLSEQLCGIIGKTDRQDLIEPASDDMDMADERTEQEEDVTADFSELEETPEGLPDLKSKQPESMPATTLLEFAQKAQMAPVLEGVDTHEDGLQEAQESSLPQQSVENKTTASSFDADDEKYATEGCKSLETEEEEDTEKSTGISNFTYVQITEMNDNKAKSCSGEMSEDGIELTQEDRGSEEIVSHIEQSSDTRIARNGDAEVPLEARDSSILADEQSDVSVYDEKDMAHVQFPVDEMREGKDEREYGGGSGDDKLDIIMAQPIDYEHRKSEDSITVEDSDEIIKGDSLKADEDKHTGEVYIDQAKADESDAIIDRIGDKDIAETSFAPQAHIDEGEDRALPPPNNNSASHKNDDEENSDNEGDDLDQNISKKVSMDIVIGGEDTEESCNISEDKFTLDGSKTIKGVTDTFFIDSDGNEPRKVGFDEAHANDDACKNLVILNDKKKDDDIIDPTHHAVIDESGAYLTDGVHDGADVKFDSEFSEQVEESREVVGAEEDMVGDIQEGRSLGKDDGITDNKLTESDNSVTKTDDVALKISSQENFKESQEAKDDRGASVGSDPLNIESDQVKSGDDTRHNLEAEINDVPGISEVADSEGGSMPENADIVELLLPKEQEVFPVESSDGMSITEGFSVGDIVVESSKPLSSDRFEITSVNSDGAFVLKNIRTKRKRKKTLDASQLRKASDGYSNLPPIDEERSDKSSNEVKEMCDLPSGVPEFIGGSPEEKMPSAPRRSKRKTASGLPPLHPRESASSRRRNTQSNSAEVENDEGSVVSQRSIRSTRSSTRKSSVHGATARQKNEETDNNDEGSVVSQRSTRSTRSTTRKSSVHGATAKQKDEGTDNDDEGSVVSQRSTRSTRSTTRKSSVHGATAKQKDEETDNDDEGSVVSQRSTRSTRSSTRKSPVHGANAEQKDEQMDNEDDGSVVSQRSTRSTRSITRKGSARATTATKKDDDEKSVQSRASTRPTRSVSKKMSRVGKPSREKGESDDERSVQSRSSNRSTRAASTRKMTGARAKASKDNEEKVGNDEELSVRKEDDFSNWTVDKLRSELKARGMKHKGLRKKALIDLLKSSREEN